MAASQDVLVWSVLNQKESIIWDTYPTICCFPLATPMKFEIFLYQEWECQLTWECIIYYHDRDYGGWVDGPDGPRWFQKSVWCRDTYFINHLMNILGSFFCTNVSPRPCCLRICYSMNDKDIGIRNNYLPPISDDKKHSPLHRRQ